MSRSYIYYYTLPFSSVLGYYSTTPLTSDVVGSPPNPFYARSSVPFYFTSTIYRSYFPTESASTEIITGLQVFDIIALSIAFLLFVAFLVMAAITLYKIRKSERSRAERYRREVQEDNYLFQLEDGDEEQPGDLGEDVAMVNAEDLA